jgi:hypothetical protein
VRRGQGAPLPSPHALRVLSVPSNLPEQNRQIFARTAPGVAETSVNSAMPGCAIASSAWTPTISGFGVRPRGGRRQRAYAIAMRSPACPRYPPVMSLKKAGKTDRDFAIVLLVSSTPCDCRRKACVMMEADQRAPAWDGRPPQGAGPGVVSRTLLKRERVFLYTASTTKHEWLPENN